MNIKSASKPLPNHLREIDLWASAIDVEAPVFQIEAEFREQPRLPGFILLHENKIVGIVSRSRFAFALSRQFAREIFMKGPIKVLFDFDVIDKDPMILDENLSVSSAVQEVLSRASLLAYEPVIVMHQNMPKLLEVDLLMRLQSDLLQEALHLHQRLIDDERNTAAELRQTMLNLEQARDRLQRSEENLEAQVVQRTLELKKVNEDLIAQQKQINEDLEVARTLQQSILPSVFQQHNDYKAHAFMRAARMIGGDFYDAYQINDYQFGFVVADVSGKGVPAALFMILVKTILEEQAINHVSPAACLQRLNAQLLLHNPLSLFVTLIYGVLDIRTGIFTFCNAGHSMPYIIRNNQKIETISNKSNPLVGLLDHPKYTNISIQLGKNDRILLMTDGVTECFNSQEEQYGELRLLHLLKKTHDIHHIDELIKALIDDLDQFSNGTPASDDITALVLQYNKDAVMNANMIDNLGVLKELTLH